MYYDFFNLNEHPFRLTCEPKYFYLSPEHTHANAMMEFALTKRQGIMLLTGEVGTGKTMLVQHFLSRLDAGYKLISINQTKLTEEEFLQLLLLEMDESVKQEDEDDSDKLLEQIHQKLEQLHSDAIHTVIFVDEAQHLAPGVIKFLSLLSQITINNERICTIYLVGQNKIRETLESPEVSDTMSVINTKYHLGPLSLKDIRRYIFHRLAVAGGHKSVKFNKEVYPLIETYTGGRPRLINVLTDHILTYAYMGESKEIDTKILDQAVEDLQWLPFGVQYGIDSSNPPDVFKQERRNSYKLVIRIDDKDHGEYFIRDKRISIGRHRDNDLRIDDPLISRQHAQILQQGRTIYLRDLNSTNGTYVNNKRVDIAPLEEGIEFKIGNAHLTFTRCDKSQTEGGSRSNTDYMDLAATRH